MEKKILEKFIPNKYMSLITNVILKDSMLIFDIYNPHHQIDYFICGEDDLFKSLNKSFGLYKDDINVSLNMFDNKDPFQLFGNLSKYTITISNIKIKLILDPSYFEKKEEKKDQMSGIDKLMEKLSSIFNVTINSFSLEPNKNNNSYMSIRFSAIYDNHFPPRLDDVKDQIKDLADLLEIGVKDINFIIDGTFSHHHYSTVKFSVTAYNISSDHFNKLIGIKKKEQEKPLQLISFIKGKLTKIFKERIIIEDYEGNESTANLSFKINYQKNSRFFVDAWEKQLKETAELFKVPTSSVLGYFDRQCEVTNCNVKVYGIKIENILEKLNVHAEGIIFYILSTKLYSKFLNKRPEVTVDKVNYDRKNNRLTIFIKSKETCTPEEVLKIEDAVMTIILNLVERGKSDYAWKKTIFENPGSGSSLIRFIVDGFELR